MAKSGSNGKLEEAMALLINNQAALFQTQAAFVAGQREHGRDIAALRRDMVEVRAHLALVIQVLDQHGKILEGLPEAVRQRMGFPVPETKSQAKQ